MQVAGEDEAAGRKRAGSVMITCMRWYVRTILALSCACSSVVALALACLTGLGRCCC